MLEYVVIIVISLLVIAGCAYSLACLVVAKQAVNPVRRTTEQVLEEEKTENKLDPILQELPFETLEMENQRQQLLKARLYRPETPNGGYLLYNHGYNYPWPSVLKYLPMLLIRGFTVLVPDHTGEGDSQGKWITFGYYEQQDSQQWLEKLQKEAKDRGETPRFGVMGESMGAVTALLMACKNPQLEFCVADCPFSSWEEILKLRMTEKMGPKWSAILLPGTKLAIRLLTGAKVEEVNPAQACKTLGVPTVLIHGEEDTYVPCSMSKAIAKGSKACRLYLIPEAKHAQSFSSAPDAYRDILYSFWDNLGF